MRICFIANQLAAWGKIGGFGTNTRRLARGLVERGVDVHAILPQRNGPRGVEVLDGIVVHGLSDPQIFFGSRLYREVDADIYHAQEPTICAYWAQRAMPDRVHLITCMDPRDSTDWKVELKNATWSRRLKYPIQRFYEDGYWVRRAIQNADGVYVESEFLKDKVAALYGLEEKPGVLPKPVEIPAGPFRKAERPLCVFLGRFDPRKRPEAFFELAARMPDIDFVAIGRAHDASQQSRLQNHYIPPNLKLTGFIDPFKDNTLHDILSSAWVLVHPAAREGLPTAFQEASVHEMAIVAFVDPGGYVSGFGRAVAEDGNVDALEAATREIIETGDWREKGRAGRAYNMNIHSLQFSLEEHLNTYSRHLEVKHPPS
jgi:glycosyltransferase involved in cell wall biosynthesis